MSENASFGSPVDNVRRDIKDNAYHCPQCDTPFTRRSNLRRHFQIHMRNSILKCDNCSDEFGSKEELQSHAPGCYSWSSVHDKTLQAMERPYGKDGTDSLLAHSQRLTQSLDGRSYASPHSAYSNFDSLGYSTSDFSQVMSSVSSSGAVIPPTPPLSSSFDGSYVNASSSSNLFPHRRPSISSSSNSSSSASSSPYTQPPTHVQATTFGYYPSTEVRADGSPWNAVPPAHAAPGEKPVYTRRQVKDMIDVVSECLIESMESVLTRPTSVVSPNSMQLDSPDGHIARAMRDDGFRQTVLSEALPRAYYRMHSGSGTHPKV
ncbi:hypothetical protein BDN70DRAFT_879175 [Pholiota conissans]|uniref:C2H2-type domain-containing protein n=1 Tax=Pholiota conissans TaxID=109636 RepID=A0A9P6D086_9AGAR|nr:hypothetical protein BDN70DRAFT_879175 [Pholiota conissans]